MRAVQFAEYGGPETLHLVDVPEPHAGAGQVRIAVRAAGINAIDWKVRAGYLAEQMPLSLPAGTGRDASGIVDEIGPEVTGIAVGDAVLGSGIDTLADFAVLTDWVRKPGGMSFEEAAGYPVPAETAQRILDQVGVQPGQTLLVSGASGGVGSAVLQFARARGIQTIGTAREASQPYVASLGAQPITYGPGLVERVRALGAPGVDAALDIAGSGVITELIELTGDPAKVLSIADFAAPEHGAQVSMGGGDTAKALASATELFEQGRFHLPVDTAFPLEQAAAAHAASERGHVVGRFVVTV